MVDWLQVLKWDIEVGWCVKRRWERTKTFEITWPSQALAWTPTQLCAPWICRVSSHHALCILCFHYCMSSLVVPIASHLMTCHQIKRKNDDSTVLKYGKFYFFTRKPIANILPRNSWMASIYCGMSPSNHRSIQKNHHRLVPGTGQLILTTVREYDLSETSKLIPSFYLIYLPKIPCSPASLSIHEHRDDGRHIHLPHTHSTPRYPRAHRYRKPLRR